VESKMRFPLSNSPCCWKTVILKKKEKIDLLHLESESAHPSFVATGFSLGPERSAVEKCSSDFQER
jgi:hypothetical protein